MLGVAVTVSLKIRTDYDVICPSNGHRVHGVAVTVPLSIGIDCDVIWCFIQGDEHELMLLYRIGIHWIRISASWRYQGDRVRAAVIIIRSDWYL